MYCNKCDLQMRMVKWRNGGDECFILFRCDGCGKEISIEDSDEVKLILLKKKLLDPKNHAHNAFVYRKITELGQVSTIELIRECTYENITNGRREARKLKKIGLLGNYKPFGKRYVIWHTRELE